MNKICKKLINVNLTGNVVPNTWYQHITMGKRKNPDLLAILILADIIYWYRPSEIRSPETNEIIGYKQKFQGDMLQKTYQSYATFFGVSKYQVKRAIDNLVKLGLVRREFRNVEAKNGTTIANLMHLEPVIDNVLKISQDAPIINDVSSMQKCGIYEKNIGITEFDHDVICGQTTSYTNSPPRDEDFDDDVVINLMKTNTETNTEITTEIISPIIMGEKKFLQTTKANKEESKSEEGEDSNPNVEDLSPNSTPKEESKIEGENPNMKEPSRSSTPEKVKDLIFSVAGKLDLERNLQTQSIDKPILGRYDPKKDKGETLGGLVGKKKKSKNTPPLKELFDAYNELCVEKRGWEPIPADNKQMAAFIKSFYDDLVRAWRLIPNLDFWKRMFKEVANDWKSRYCIDNNIKRNLAWFFRQKNLKRYLAGEFTAEVPEIPESSELYKQGVKILEEVNE